MKHSVIWIGYTTQYRDGSEHFERAAHTLAAEKRASHGDSVEVKVVPITRKADFVRSMARFVDCELAELHLIGHSGMYGPMFGTTRWPEQFSPHEWRTITIPFASSGRAYFHACRTGRWFARFFAQTFGVTAYGNHAYTTVSSRRDRFALRIPLIGQPTYMIACPGKKSHGLWGSIQKYAGAKTQPMLEFTRATEPLDASYDAVSGLYENAFADIRVRRAEWQWLQKRVAQISQSLGTKPAVLDVGCGNGALLHALEGRIASGTGVDASSEMIRRARENKQLGSLRFEHIAGPALPFADATFDVVTSLLSFRYLDWEPMTKEICRVLKPSGRFLMVDMVERPATLRDLEGLARAGTEAAWQRLSNPTFVRNLRSLTSHPDWKKMLDYNPIRAEHEYRWYFESRFPERKLETLSVARRSRVVAFDTGAVARGRFSPLTFP